MKKILLVIGLIALTAGAGHAITCDSFRCPANPYEGSFSFSNLTGINFLAEKIGNAIIKKAINKESQGKYKVNLQSYNTGALKKGIFKTLEINGTNTVTDGIYISKVKFKTICDYNYIEIDNKQKTATFQEPFGMAYAFQITADDLNKTMLSSSYQEMIRKINNIGNTSKIFNVSSTSAKIENNKLYYTFRAAVPLLKMKQDITIQTDISARNGKVVLKDTKLVTNSFKLDMNKLEKLINYLNPLEFSLGIFDDDYAKTKVQEITIKDNVINLSGIVVIDEGTVTEI
ncbi:hypothetical protein IKP85_03155 [bacterium]|nr:hypothetical protein [bacterium]